MKVWKWKRNIAVLQVNNFAIELYASKGGMMHIHKIKHFFHVHGTKSPPQFHFCMTKPAKFTLIYLPITILYINERGEGWSLSLLLSLLCLHSDWATLLALLSQMFSNLAPLERNLQYPFLYLNLFTPDTYHFGG